MKAKDIEIKNYKTIGELYEFLEQNAFSIDKYWDFAHLWSKYKSHTSSKTEQQSAQWEQEAFYFAFKGVEPFSFTYSGGKTGRKTNKYPTLDNLQGAGFDYLKKRAKKVKNSLLCSRYNHLLWKGPKGIKHRKYAKIAIHSYLKCITEYLKFDKGNNSKSHLQIGKQFETAAALCNEVNEGRDEIKSMASKLLFKENKISFHLKYAVLKDMLENNKVFKKGDFVNCLTLFDEELQKKKTDDSLLANNHLPTALKIAEKTGSDPKKWLDEIGLAYLRMAKAQEGEDRNWIKLHFYALAIRQFLSSGNTVRKEEVEQWYFELKPNVKLSTTRVHYDQETLDLLEETQNDLKKIADKLLDQGPHKVYYAISNGFFFPKYVDVLRAVENKGDSFLNFVTTIQFDKNKNILDNSQKNKDSRTLYETYGLHLNTNVTPFLHFIFIPGIKSGRLTFENLISYIAKKSWIGKPHINTDLGGEPTEIDWINLLAPSLIEYFVQIEGAINSKYYSPSFILCIDSLVLKIEGLLREFCARLNVSTSVGTVKGIQEANINKVLENKVVKQFFNEDDMLLFHYLFTNKGGLNLRNSVAHGLLSHEAYNSDTMLLLIAAILRIAKYDYKSNN